MQKKNRLFNYRPVLSICLFLMAGIIFVVNIYIGKAFNIVLACLMGVALIATFITKLIKAKEIRLFKLLSIVIAFVVGACLSVGFIEIYSNKTEFDGDYFIEARVCERTRMSSSSKMIVTIDSVYATSLKTLKKTKVSGKVRLYLEEGTGSTREFALGEEITANVELSNVELFDEDRNNFSLFNRGIYVLGFGSEDDIVTTNNIDSTISEKFKTKVKSILDTHMDEEYSELAYTMLFGDKAGLDESIQTTYSASGIGHLLAVSGLHVGFIVTMLSFVLNKLKASRTVKFWVITIVIFIYAFLCGFTVSVTRAFIMTAILLYTKSRMFDYDSLNSLGLAAVVILITNPLWLFDAGFQLSFLAVAGIIILAPILTRFFKRYFHEKFASTLSVCIAAQVGTVPVMMTTFSSFSIFSIVTNLICIPIASMAYMFLFASSLFAVILAPLGVFTYMFEFLMKLVTAISSLTGAISLAGANKWMMIIFSVSLLFTCILGSDNFFLQQKKKNILSLVMSMVTVASFVMIFIC